VAAVSTPSGPLVVATVVDSESWGEVIVREWDGAERVLTEFNAGYPIEAEMFAMAEITATAADGYPVHGWTVRPSGAGPHPLLLLIHGGPFAQYGWQLFDEAQIYASAGYAVLMANPRGSSGYGQAHGRAVIGNVGEVSTGDLMAILEAALKSADFDATRVGVLGGSHGGFMTTWLAAHEGHRFRAAVSERAVNAIDSFTGSSDIGWFFADALYGPDVVGQRKQSPLTYANDIHIPMLIIHSEQDWRCPIEQAQRLYVALRRNGTPAEMLLFPGEGHEMSRSGLPSHRIARAEAIVEWFDRHMSEFVGANRVAAFPRPAKRGRE
jgi:dipeptidyl aminopeptidase/acylaminoacyl peptidase